MDPVKWTRYTYVCDPDHCDSLIEYTCKDDFGFPSGSVMNITCPCGRKPQLLSVQDATIGPLITNPKGNEMEDTVSKDAVVAMWRQELELTYGNQITELQNKLSSAEQKAENNFELFKNANSQISRIISWMDQDGWYNPNTDKEDILSELCDILEYTPKKEVSFTATIQFSGRIDLDLADAEDFDLHEFLSDAYVDVNHGDVVIDDYELTEADEC